MIETYGSDWDKFERSGRVDDYLQYRGVNRKSFSGIKGEQTDDNCKWNSNILQGSK